MAMGFFRLVYEYYIAGTAMTFCVMSPAMLDWWTLRTEVIPEKVGVVHIPVYERYDRKTLNVNATNATLSQPIHFPSTHYICLDHIFKESQCRKCK